MKKYLIKGLLALVVGGFTASCADKDGDYVPVGQQKATAYADAFKELIGGEVSPSHDWGFTKTSIIEDFSQTRANTRAFTRGNSMGEVIKPDMTTFPGYSTERTHSDNYRSPEGYADIVAPITTAEAAWVQAWFDDPANAGLSEEGRDFDNFFVQQVAHRCYNTDKPGYFWEMKNGVEEHTDKNYNVKMDQLRIGPTRDESDAVTLHIYDFNAVDNGQNAWNLIYVQGGSSKQFGYHASYDNSWQWKFRCVQLTVPGRCFGEGEADRTGWYVGLSYWTDKIEVAGVKGERIGENDVNQGNDWILKIVPGDITPSGGETSSNSTSTRKDRVERSRLVRQGRIFCEDLGTNADKISKSDIDFNDAVFDAKIWRKGQFDVEYLDDTYNSESDYLENIYTTGIKGIDIEMDENRDAHVVVNGKFKYVAEICLLAAGGTIPLKIGGNKGFEIHSKFGQGQNPSRNIAHTTIINTVGAPSQEQFTTTVSTDVCDAVTVEVDITEYVKEAIEDGNTDIGLDIIPIDVEWVSGNHQSVGELSSEYGQAPQKLCVPIGTPWVYERIPITTAYKDFDKYAKEYSPSNPLTFWDPVKNTIDTNYLYANGPEGMTAETGESGNIGSNPFYDEVIIKGSTTTTTEVETVLWEGTNTYPVGGDNGTDMTLYSKDFSADGNTYVRVYATINTNNSSNVQFEIKEDPGWNTIMTFLASDHNGQYFEKKVDSTFANGITTLIHAWGRDCTITKICKVVKTTTTK